MEGNRPPPPAGVCASDCPILCITKVALFVLVSLFILCLPLGDPDQRCVKMSSQQSRDVMQYVCELYRSMLQTARLLRELLEAAASTTRDACHHVKLRLYEFLSKHDKDDLCAVIHCSGSETGIILNRHILTKMRSSVVPLSVVAASLAAFLHTLQITEAMEVAKSEIDKVIEDEITQKLGEDLLQSIERKFQVDLERSVNIVLLKIRMLLQNGTVHVQDRLLELQEIVDAMKRTDEKQVEACLSERQNATSALAEKALHQMVVCGYALVGHDPSRAVRSVLALKHMITEGLKPIYEQKRELYGSLKTCGHNHESLKKVVKCVISKSPLIKTAMMEVTGKLIEGVVDLTKLMAHGAMHEACLIEVIKSVQDEAFQLLSDVRSCVYRNSTMIEVENYLIENNATVLDIENKNSRNHEPATGDSNIKEVKEMKDLIRRMLTDKGQELDKRFKKKLIKLQTDLKSMDANIASNTIIDN